MAIQPEQTVVLPAYAKVNLCLSVQFPPVNGYHKLDSVFQTLDLHDTLEFSVYPQVEAFSGAVTGLGTHVELDCGPIDLPVQDNLIFKAIDRVEQAYGRAMVASGEMLRIVVEKHIPAGGGLGGGSADAAAALRAYCQLQGIDPLDGPALLTARSLGADVAFFLYGGAALMVDRGDVLERTLPDFKLPLVLMGDDIGNSTAEVYRTFDANAPKAPDAYALAAAMEDASTPAEQLAALCANNLEPAALEIGPQIINRLDVANASPDVLKAIVTGSGSTSYAICPDLESAKRFATEIAPHCAWTAVTQAHPGK